MTKLAYEYGTLAALRLFKTADEDIDVGEHEAGNENPAEILASLFQQAQIYNGKQTPDNKTRPEDGPIDNEPHWGKSVSGHGGERLERLVPGFHMPQISAI